MKRDNLSLVATATIILFTVSLTVQGFDWPWSSSPKAVATPTPAPKPPLLIDVSYRTPLWGPGRVLRFLNRSGKSLELTFTWTSRATGAVQKWTTTIIDQGVLHGEYGHAEGFPFASGDTIVISHPDYRPITSTVP
jgi:hypothetical protein